MFAVFSGKIVSTTACCATRRTAPIAIANTVFNLVSSLFGDDDPPPEPWDNASAIWSGSHAATSGDHGGLEPARSTMDSFIANRLLSISTRNYMRTHVIPEGILIETSQVTQIDDRSAIEANGDGVTTYEDIETIVSTADLLANDSVGGWSGQNLTVTGVSSFTHGAGYLNGNGFVHYTPDANYTANQARWKAVA